MFHVPMNQALLSRRHLKGFVRDHFPDVCRGDPHILTDASLLDKLRQSSPHGAWCKRKAVLFDKECIFSWSYKFGSDVQGVYLKIDVYSVSQCQLSWPVMPGSLVLIDKDGILIAGSTVGGLLKTGYKGIF